LIEVLIKWTSKVIVRKIFSPFSLKHLQKYFHYDTM